MSGIEKLYVLRWNYGPKTQTAAPYASNNPQMIPDFKHGRFMVYSKEIAQETAAENNRLYGTDEKKVEVVPLADFLKAAK